MVGTLIPVHLVKLSLLRLRRDDLEGGRCLCQKMMWRKSGSGFCKLYPTHCSAQISAQQNVCPPGDKYFEEVAIEVHLLDGQRRLLKKPPNPRAWRRRRLRALRKKSPQSRQMRLKIRQPSNQIPLRLFLVDNDSHVDL